MGYLYREGFLKQYKLKCLEATIACITMFKQWYHINSHEGIAASLSRSDLALLDRLL